MNFESFIYILVYVLNQVKMLYCIKLRYIQLLSTQVFSELEVINQ